MPCHFLSALLALQGLTVVMRSDVFAGSLDACAVCQRHCVPLACHLAYMILTSVYGAAENMLACLGFSLSC